MSDILIKIICFIIIIVILTPFLYGVGLVIYCIFNFSFWLGFFIAGLVACVMAFYILASES